MLLMQIMEEFIEQEVAIPKSPGREQIESYKIPETQVEQFIHTFYNGSTDKQFVLREASNKESEALPASALAGIICYQKINNVRYLNKFFEAINRSLLPGGVFVGCLETQHQLQHRMRQKYPVWMHYPYFFLLFIGRRVLPKWAITKRMYFYLTKGKKRVISLTEVLGRLTSCGFEVFSYKQVDGLTWYSVRKTEKPEFDMSPTYGFLVKLKRVGKGGKPIHIYKFRTMHPYAEYLQDYVYRLNNLKEGGKLNGDMRITGWGKVMRKLWLDEQPMWWNFLKRELKLVGVRPLSRQYFNLYPKEMQEMRIQNKPGLIPPFYYDLPKTFDEILKSERRYLEAYQKHPVKTDIRYFFGALYNIFIKKARSG
ncbi:MAG: sugar transferase [Balneolales bacterium]